MAFPQGSIPGIDVSHDQGVVDWPTVAAGGEVFAYAKATEGLTIADQYFHDNWAAMKAAGLLRGAYHFYHPNDDPAAQATAFLAALTAANGTASLAPGDMPPMLDLEVTNGQTAATILAGAATWLQLVADATGRTPLLYTFRSFWLQSLANSNQLSDYPLWIARYGVSAPGQIGGWADWTIWQFNSAATIGGVQGTVDADGFQGSLTELQALAGCWKSMTRVSRLDKQASS